MINILGPLTGALMSTAHFSKMKGIAQGQHEIAQGQQEIAKKVTSITGDDPMENTEWHYPIGDKSYTLEEMYNKAQDVHEANTSENFKNYWENEQAEPGYSGIEFDEDITPFAKDAFDMASKLNQQVKAQQGQIQTLNRQKQNMINRYNNMTVQEFLKMKKRGGRK